MKVFYVLLFFCGTLIPRVVLERVEEGMNIRYSREGLMQAHNLLLSSWKKILLEMQLPAIKETDYFVNFKVVSVHLGENDITTAPPNLITSHTVGGRLVVKADWILVLDASGKVKEHSGTTLLSFVDVDVMQQVLLQYTDINTIRFVSGLCQTKVDGIYFNASAADYTERFFFHVFASLMKRKAEKLLCEATRETLVSEFNEVFPFHYTQVPLELILPMYKNISIRSTFTKPPVVTTSGVTLFGRGDCFPSGGDFRDSWENQLPLSQTQNPPFSKSNQMLQFVIGNYLLNSLNYALYQIQYFNEIDPIDLFNEHFNSDLSASKLAEDIPAFESHRNRPIEFVISARSAPTTEVNASRIFTTEQRNMIVNTIYENGTREAVVSLNYTNEISSQLYVMNDVIHLRVMQMDSIADGFGIESLFFNTFRAEANIRYLKNLNDALTKKPYIIPRYGIFRVKALTVKLALNGIQFGGDIQKEDQP